MIPVQIILTGEKGVGKHTILNLFPEETILEIDLNLNEFPKKSIDLTKLGNIDQCILRIIDLEDLIDKFDSFKDLLDSTDIICFVLNSVINDIENNQKILSNLKEKVSDVSFYIIANFQDKEELALDVNKIEAILKEKTFGFSAIQHASKERIFSIIDEIVRMTIEGKDEKKHKFTKYDDLWLELEKARVFETEGDRIKAIAKFSNVASQIKNLSLVMELENEREELEALHYLCKAWECMIYAEEYQEPLKFSEAMNHFVQASEIIDDNKLKQVLLGDSEFCKILKFGMEFEHSNQTRIRTNDYLKIKEFFNKIMELYKQGSFEKGVNWALAKASYFDEFVKEFKKD
ncbi:MAG: hypothetical protein ACFFA7_16495 [Promethearchaeota archaeon]